MCCHHTANNRLDLIACTVATAKQVPLCHFLSYELRADDCSWSLVRAIAISGVKQQAPCSKKVCMYVLCKGFLGSMDNVGKQSTVQ